MTPWKPTAAYDRIASANREFYSQTASLYDASETCVSDPRLQAELEQLALQELQASLVKQVLQASQV